MELFTKRFWKFASLFAAIVLLGLGTLWASVIVLERTNPEYAGEKRALEQIEELERQYREDPYGGDTPEETLELFTQALKAGDIDLASKYFLPDEQEKWKNFILDIHNENNLKLFIEDLGRAELSRKDDRQSLFVIANNSNIVTTIISVDNFC